MHAVAEWFVCFFFGVEHRGFLKEEVETYLMTPILPLNSPTFFPSSHLLSMGTRVVSYYLGYMYHSTYLPDDDPEGRPPGVRLRVEPRREAHVHVGDGGRQGQRAPSGLVGRVRERNQRHAAPRRPQAPLQGRVGQDARQEEGQGHLGEPLRRCPEPNSRHRCFPAEDTGRY